MQYKKREVAFKNKDFRYKHSNLVHFKVINSPVTGSFIKLNTAPGFSFILKQMASSFCSTDIMKCGSPSTVKASHRYLYSDAQVQIVDFASYQEAFLNLPYCGRRLLDQRWLLYPVQLNDQLCEHRR